VPIYESAGQGRVTARWFRRVIRTALDDLTPELAETFRGVRERLALLSPREALWKVHWPEAGESFEDLQSRAAAHVRLIFEELFFVELDWNSGAVSKRRRLELRFGWTTGFARRSRKFCRFIPPRPKSES